MAPMVGALKEIYTRLMGQGSALKALQDASEKQARELAAIQAEVFGQPQEIARLKKGNEQLKHQIGEK